MLFRPKAVLHHPVLICRGRLSTPVAFVCLLVCASMASACSDRSYDRIRQQGSIRIGYAVEAPYAFLTPDGEVTGESPEIARRIAARLGIGRIDWRQVEFGSLISGLQAGEFDAIAAGIFITPARAREVAFSIPTFHVHPALLVPKGNPKDLHSYKQALEFPHIRISVLSGSVEEASLRSIGFTDDRLVIVPDARTGEVTVVEGIADALAVSSPTVRWMTMQDQAHRTEMAASFGEQEAGTGAFAFRTEDTQLREAWNAELRRFIGTDEHITLIRRFGFTETELPALGTQPSGEQSRETSAR